MNIFILNENPELAARDYCNKHLPKDVCRDVTNAR